METLKKQLEEYRRKKKTQEFALKAKSSEIEDLKSHIQQFEEKITVLQTKHSNLAASVLNEVSRQLKEKREQLDNLLRTSQTLTENIEFYTQEISRLTTDPTPYIEEQVQYMIEEFSEYIQENENSLALNITTVFSIDSVREHHYLSYLGPLPTGIFGIFEIEPEKNDDPIIDSKDFYFDQPLYKKRDNMSGVEYSEWYKNFEDIFFTTFMKKLEEVSRELNDSFRIIIKDKKSFSIELL